MNIISYFACEKTSFGANLTGGLAFFFVALYIYYRFLYPDKRLSRAIILKSIACGILSAFVYALLFDTSQSLASVAWYLMPSLFIVLAAKRDRFVKAGIGFVSVSIMHIFKVLSVYTVILLYSAFFSFSDYERMSTVVFIVCFALTFLTAIWFLHIKSLCRGISFFFRRENLGLGLVLSSLVFFTANIEADGKEHRMVFYLIVAIVMLTSGLGFYFWIRSSITAHYRERMKLRNEEHYRQLLTEKEQELEKLRQSNEYLAKVVHRDNHLVQSLGAAVDAYFQSGDRAFRDDLLREVKAFAEERGELLPKEQIASRILPSTGNLMIDGAINGLYAKAVSRGIDCSLSVSAAADEVIGKYLSRTELQTLLCDHIKNAVIAVEAKGEENGKIYVSLSEKNGCYEIGIFASGIPFEIATLDRLGKEPATTHADSGGSGIGFMTTFRVLEKARASLMITEFENPTPFSKSVVFRFDGASAFIISSCRGEELKAALGRSDVLLQQT